MRQWFRSVAAGWVWTSVAGRLMILTVLGVNDRIGQSRARRDLLAGLTNEDPRWVNPGDLNQATGSYAHGA